MLRPGEGCVMTDLASCGKTNCSDFPSANSIVYFEVSSLVIMGPSVTLDAPKPLDLHVALVSRQQEPHGIAVCRSHALAVLIERDQRVTHGLGQRHGAAHAGGIGALR